MNKKITSTALAALMIAGTTSFSAFAAMGNGTVVIGAKAYDLAYANDPANVTEISAAIVAGGGVYIKDFNGSWINNTTGASVNASVIPAVTYTNSTGTKQYAAGDIDASTNATVTAVKATGVTEITITGTSLDKLAKTDITVADNTVESVTSNAAGTEATVALTDTLVADQSTAVKVKDVDYTVKFNISATAVAVSSGIYDNDTSKQYVAITVDGKSTTTTDLAAAGYDVEFSAVDKKTGGSSITDELFLETDTGKLLANLNDYLDGETKKDVYVQVTLTKGSDITVSALQKVTIQNTDIVASTISDYTIENTSIDGEGVDQNSTKLVTGEDANFKEIKVTVDGNEETVKAGNFTVKSSKPSVVYTTDDGVLSAIAPGTATLTLTYGNVTKTVSITVVKDERELTKVQVEKNNTDTSISSLKIAEVESTVELVALDQYGDPIQATVYPKSSDNSVIDTADLVSVDVDPSESGTKFTFNPIDTGSATISFYDTDAYAYKIAGSALSVNILENGDVSKSTLDLYEPTNDADADSIISGADSDDISDDLTIDMQDDKYAVFQLNQLTSAGVSLGAAEVTDEPTVAASRADVLDDSFGTDGVSIEGDKIIVKAGTKTGTATIKVTDPTTGLIYTKKITIVDDGNSIKSVAFKTIADPTYSKTYKFDAAVSKTDSGDLDPKISGIVMEKAVSQSIRLEKSSGILYIDKDADGSYTDEDTDKQIGTLTMTAVGTFENATDGEELALDGDGITVVSGDDGSVIYKVLDLDGDVVDATSFSVDF